MSERNFMWLVISK